MKGVRLFTIWLSLITIFFATGQSIVLAALTETKYLNVKANVLPNAADVQVELTANYPQTSQLGELQEVTFTVSYTSSISGVQPLNLELGWPPGLIEGSGGSYFEAYEYVIGSATVAHDGTVPVIDIVHNKIIWDIKNLSSANGAQSVSFTLRVKNNLPTNQKIDLNTYLRAIFGTIPITEQTYKLIAYKDYVAPTPTEPIPTSLTPTFGPTGVKSGSTNNSNNGNNNSGSKRNPVPPTAAPGKVRSDLPDFYFEKITIEQLQDEYVQIKIRLSLAVPMSISYGICGTKLNQSVELDAEEENHILDIHNLVPDTKYCFQVKAYDNINKRTITSDIFSFKTASGKEQFKLQNTLITWNNVVLNAGKSEKLVTPFGENIVMNIQIDNQDSIEEVSGSFIEKNVLGESTLTEAHMGIINFMQMTPGIYSAEMQTPKTKNTYQFQLQIKDVYGSLLKKVLPIEFVISEPLRIIDRASQKPIENAYVQIEKLDLNSQRFVSMQDVFRFPYLENGVILPYYSDAKGRVNLFIPSGKYRLTVEAPGYETAQLNYALGIDKLFYPRIELIARGTLDGYFSKITAAITLTGKFVPFYIHKFFGTRTLLISALIFQIILFIFALIGIALKHRFYIHILHSGKKKQTIKLFLIHLIKSGLIIIIFISTVFGILFSFAQSIITALPFFVTVGLLIFMILNGKTPARELE